MFNIYSRESTRALHITQGKRSRGQFLRIEYKAMMRIYMRPKIIKWTENPACAKIGVTGVVNKTDNLEAGTPASLVRFIIIKLVRDEIVIGVERVGALHWCRGGCDSADQYRKGQDSDNAEGNHGGPAR